MHTETLVPNTARGQSDAEAFVTFTVAGQLFGVPVMRVQDILTPDVIAPVPGGPKEVRGLINLREGNPATLDAVWRDVADAVYRTEQGLMVALHVDRLLAIETNV